MSKRPDSQSSSHDSLRVSTSSKDRPLRFNVRHLDIEIKQRQRAKVVVRQKQRRKHRTVALTFLLLACFIFINVTNGNIQRVVQRTNNTIQQSVVQTQNAAQNFVFETRQKLVDFPKALRVRRFTQVEQISLPKSNTLNTASNATLNATSNTAINAVATGVAAQPQVFLPLTTTQVDPSVGFIDNLTMKPVKVALQIGHLHAAKHPTELANLRQNTGGLARGVAEVDINQTVANIVKKQLEYYGISVELLPATVPPDYQADVFVSIHADSSTDLNRRGYKSAYAIPERNSSDKLLKSLIDESFFNASGLPDDHDNVSSNMTEYYAFNRSKFLHSIASATPAVIIEMGYLSHEEDVIFLQDSKRPATALTEGILKFLNATDVITHLPYQPNYALQMVNR